MAFRIRTVYFNCTFAIVTLQCFLRYLHLKRYFYVSVFFVCLILIAHCSLFELIEMIAI